MREARTSHNGMTMPKSNKNAPSMVQEGDLLPQKGYADTVSSHENDPFGGHPK